MAAPTNAALVQKVLANPEPSTHGPLQAESDDLEKLVLRICIRPIHGAFELLAIMDIRARSISFASRPRRPEGPPDHERAGETFLHLLISTRRPRWESQLNNCFGYPLQAAALVTRAS